MGDLGEAVRWLRIAAELRNHPIGPDLVRFLIKVAVPADPENDCWIWIGAIAQGYGRFQVGGSRAKGGQSFQAHRLSYLWWVGPIPEDRILDHLCRNRACVNPRHLEPVAVQTNVLRGEGFAALNARKTHCPRGHPYSGENLRFNVNGQRQCVTCCRRRNLAQYYQYKARKTGAVK